MAAEYGFKDFVIGIFQPIIDLLITIAAFGAPIVLSAMAGLVARLGNSGSQDKRPAGAVAVVVGSIIGGIAFSAKNLYLHMFEWMHGNLLPDMSHGARSPEEFFWTMLSVFTSLEELVIETGILGLLDTFTRNGILLGIVAIVCPIVAWNSAKTGG